MKVFSVSQVLKQGINIKTMCPYYILEFRNMTSHLLQVYLGVWVKIEIVIKKNQNYFQNLNILPQN